MNAFRRQGINEFIQANGRATYEDLMMLYPDVSCMTLRRDIEALEQEGLVVRVRGGARSVTSISADNDDKYAIRAAANVGPKTEVAQKVLEYIEPDHSLYFDSGSTVMLVANKLTNLYYSITTAAPNIAMELLRKNRITVNLLGGRFNRDTVAVSGFSAIEQVNSVNIDVAIMATSGFSVDCGFTSGEYDEVQLKKAVIKRARKVIMVMDSSKLGKALQYTFASLEDIDMIVLEKEPDAETLALCQKHNVTVVY